MANVALASVPVTDVGPSAPSRGGVVRTAAYPTPTTSTTARPSPSSPRRSRLRPRDTALPPGPSYQTDQRGQPEQGADHQPEGRLGAGRRRQRQRRRVRPGRLRRAVEPVAGRRVPPRLVVAVVLAAREEARVLDRQPGRERRPTRVVGRRVDGEVVGPVAARVDVVPPAVA